MKKALLIAEKPSERRIIEDVYKKHKSEIPYEITFLEQRGHLLTLLLPSEMDEEQKKWKWENLPFHPENHGGWKYKSIEEKKVGSFLTAKERFKKIQEELASGKYDFVINAGDPDQEGELLVRMVLTQLKCTLPIKRYWSNDTTEYKVLDALKSLKDDEHDPMLVNLLAAAYGRQHSDYRFGMNLSEAASLKMAGRVALGRVKTPILSIVCKRENEIRDFTPSTCYGVKVNYVPGFFGQLFESSLEKADEEEDNKEGLIYFEKKEDAESIIKSIGKQAKVISFEKKEEKKYAPKLFKLSSIQIEAGKFGFSPSKTLEIIQKLYEESYVSYPRTDCEYLSSSENYDAMLDSASSIPQLKPFVDFIDKSKAIPMVKKTKKWVDDKKLEDSGHSALVPTTKKPDFLALSEEEKKIYFLICQRFVAIFLPPLIQEKKVLITQINDKTFKSNGKSLVSAGYTKIFGTKFTDNIIPDYADGDVIEVNDFELVEKTTTCPKRFTDADLIAVCEAPHKYLDDARLKALGKNLKIGTPATRAAILEGLITRDKYLTRKKEKKVEYIIPTVTGMQIYENLKDCDICKVDLTGQWEEKLEDVRSGKMSLGELEAYMMAKVEEQILNIKEADIKSLTNPAFTKIATCPKCGKSIISSPKGFYCEGYKDGCKVSGFKKVCDSTIADEDFKELLDGKTVAVRLKKGSSIWTQKMKYNFDECKIEFIKEEESKYSCPNCMKKLMDDGRTLKCDCGFVFWLNPCSVIIPEDEMDKFFDKGYTSVIKGFKSKAGKTFSARIVLNEDKTGTEFKFPKRKRW